MNFDNAMVGLRKGYAARRPNWRDVCTHIRLDGEKLLEFRSDFGWDEWMASKEDFQPTDWEVAYPARHDDNMHL